MRQRNWLRRVGIGNTGMVSHMVTTTSDPLACVSATSVITVANSTAGNISGTTSAAAARASKEKGLLFTSELIFI